MVTHVHITVNDELGERVKQVKSDRGLTWIEFLKLAAEELEE